jgi:hypothetical protein
MRYTRKFIEARFEIAMKAVGLPTGPSWIDGKAQIGICSIDYAAVYGGYTIRMIANAGGGESSPFGQERHKASEFVALLTGIIRASEIIAARSL